MNHAATAAALLAALLLGFAGAWWLLSARDSGSPEQAAAGSAASDEREILYWVAPMDPSFRRDKPGKSPMGMDLLPVYADDQDAAGSDQPALRISPVVMNNIGVKTATAQRSGLPRTLATVARVVPNEYRLGHVHVRTEGWIEYLSVHTEGARVEQGEVLFRFYAPALVSAQQEYLQALQLQQSALIAAAAERLLALGLQPRQIDRLKQDREVERLVDIRAPRDGYVLELNVRHGMYVTPALMIMSIADLSSVWVEIDVPERQAGWIEAGQPARVTLASAPGRVWPARVDYVYPTLRAESRTLRARLVFDNPGLVFRPGMYASVRIDAGTSDDVVVVPSQAVIRSGDQQRVILALGDGYFRPAQVRTGLESEGRVEILAGLAAGEKIVISSQFLIDSEASLDASLLRMIDDAPTQTLPRKRGRDESRGSNSLPHELRTDESSDTHPNSLIREQRKHASPDAHLNPLPGEQPRDESPGSNSLPREQPRDESLSSNSLPRVRGRAGVGANGDGASQ